MKIDNSNLFPIVRTRKVIYYHWKIMMGKDVATVALLFPKAKFM